MVKKKIICPFCKNLSNEIFSYTKPPKEETKFQIKNYFRQFYKCIKCHHYHAVHKINLNNLYDSDYLNYTYGNIENLNLKMKKILNFAKNKSDNFGRVKRVNTFKDNNLSAKPRLLDVGAGIGVFPYMMRQNGWDVTGIETDERMVAHLRNNAGIKAFHLNELDKLKKENNKFDMISLNKVLEHLKRPLELLEDIIDLLNEKGFIYLEVPSSEAAKNGKFSEEFFIEHYHVFSINSLEIFIDIAKLKKVYIKNIIEPSGKFTLYGFFQKQ